MTRFLLQKCYLQRHLRHRDSPAEVQVRHVTNQDDEAKSPEGIALPLLSGIQDFRHLHDLIRTFHLERT